MDDDKLLYKVPHVAELLETSRSKTYELVASGEIPSIRLGGSIRVTDLLKKLPDGVSYSLNLEKRAQ
jgi:excisionase family DNA binding protein